MTATSDVDILSLDKDEITKLIGSLQNPTPLNSIAIANMKRISKDVVASASAAARGTAAHAQKAMLNIKPSELISVNPLGGHQ